MPDILPILLLLSPVLSKTSCQQLHRIVVAMLAMTGRITQLGISRWTDKGGSYRTVQRFFHTQIDWLAVKWLFFTRFVYDQNGTYLLAGDETVVTKSGKRTHGLDRFFSSLCDRAVPGLAFFSMALIHVGKRQAYSLSNEQVIRTEEEKQSAKQRKQKQKSQKQKQKGKNSTPKKPRGRPKGSKNKNKADLPLSHELLRIQAQAKKVTALLQKKMAVSYFVLDGHFGNSLACQMVRQLDLHLISKMRADAALYLQPTALQKQTTPQRKYGDRLDVTQMPEALLCSTHTEDGYETRVYRALCLHKHFGRLLNVVILKRTHQESGRVGHVILFSSDLFLGAEALIDYYRLRFQIEFTFRDAKQHFGLEDFMGIHKTSVANAMSLSLFMVNLSSYLLGSLRTRFSGAGISDLKSWYRGRHYASALLKMLPENPDTIICEQILEQMCQLGVIHLPSDSASRQKMAA
jgi:putative transposase